jgi:hypothetical protein
MEASSRSPFLSCVRSSSPSSLLQLQCARLTALSLSLSLSLLSLSSSLLFSSLSLSLSLLSLSSLSLFSLSLSAAPLTPLVLQDGPVDPILKMNSYKDLNRSYTALIASCVTSNTFVESSSGEVAGEKPLRQLRLLFVLGLLFFPLQVPTHVLVKCRSHFGDLPNWC